MQLVDDLAATVGVGEACRVRGITSSRYDRARQMPLAPPPRARPTPARTLSLEERTTVSEILNSERFQDCAPREVYATLLDEGAYLCSWRTM